MKRTRILVVEDDPGILTGLTALLTGEGYLVYPAVDGRSALEVSRREVQLLRLFVENEGDVIDRVTLPDRIWGIRYEGTTRTLDQHIAKLRKKIEDDPLPSPVHHDGARRGVPVLGGIDRAAGEGLSNRPVFQPFEMNR